jgi:hypothetical protein
MATAWSSTSKIGKEGSSIALGMGSINRRGRMLSVARRPPGGKSKVSLIETNQSLRRQAVNLLLEIVELREELSHRSGQPDPSA